MIVCLLAIVLIIVIISVVKGTMMSKKEGLFSGWGKSKKKKTERYMNQLNRDMRKFERFGDEELTELFTTKYEKLKATLSELDEIVYNIELLSDEHKNGELRDNLVELLTVINETESEVEIEIEKQTTNESVNSNESEEVSELDESFHETMRNIDELLSEKDEETMQKEAISRVFTTSKYEDLLVEATSDLSDYELPDIEQARKSSDLKQKVVPAFTNMSINDEEGE